MRLKKVIFIFFSLIFLLLLFRNPFSTRTLIPNFDPFPDATYYLSPPLNLLKGYGLNMYREGRYLVPGVAPLYSLILLPIFIIKADPRMFYFANVLLSLASFYFYYLIIKKVIKLSSRKLSSDGLDKYLELFIFTFSLILFPFNFYFYWYALFAMAENLILPLFLIGIYLLISEVSFWNTIFAAFISISFLATKYAALPMSIIYPALYLIKIINFKSISKFKAQSNRKYFKQIAIFLFVLSFFLGIFLAHDHFFKNNYFLNTVFGESKPLVKQISSLTSKPVTSNSKPIIGWFSIFRIQDQIQNYLKSLFGYPSRVLWETTPLLPNYLAIFSVIGLIAGLFYKEFRFLSFSLLSLLFGQILFLSTYNTFDYRYCYFAIPTLLIGLVMLFAEIIQILNFKSQIVIFNKAQNLKSKVILGFGIFILIGFYSFSNFKRIKAQIGLNLKYTETPWYYLAIQKLNTDFPKNKNPKPKVISSMLPYYIDFYSNGNYELLPLDKTQDLMWYADQVWGKEDYSDLNKIYSKYLKKGIPVYFFSYYKGIRFSDSELRANFELKLVSTGCLNTCNLYKLHIKQK